MKDGIQVDANETYYVPPEQEKFLREIGILKSAEDTSEQVGRKDGDGAISPRAPNYVVLRQGSTSPEPLWAQSDEEATGIVRRQVRSGQTAVVRLYKLMCAEVFVPSSETLTPEQLLDRLQNTESTAQAANGK